MRTARGANSGIEIGRAPHQEGAASRLHRRPIVQTLVPTVRQQPLARQGVRGRQELAFGLLVGRHRHVDHLVVEHTQEGMQFHRGRANGGEASAKGPRQRIVDGEGTAILHHHVLEGRQLPVRGRTQDVEREVPQDVLINLLHESGKRRLRQPIVERLVLRAPPRLGVEGAQDVRDGLDLARTEGFDQRTHQALRGHVPQPAAVAALPPPRRHARETERGSQRHRESGSMRSVQRWPPFDRTTVIQPREWQVTVELCKPSHRSTRASDLESMTYKILPMRKH